MGAVAALAAALFAFLGDRMIAAYGNARFEAGVAVGQIRQFPAILASQQAAAQAALDRQDRMIAAGTRHASEIARIAASFRTSDEEFHAYAATLPGRADCLDPERVRAIEAARAALFAARATPGIDASGSVPAN